jgi:hypothetical protein
MSNYPGTLFISSSDVKYNNLIKILNYKDRNGGGRIISMFYFLKIIFYILQSFPKFSFLVCLFWTPANRLLELIESGSLAQYI